MAPGSKAFDWRAVGAFVALLIGLLTVAGYVTGDKMDSKMDEGIVVGAEKIKNPDLNQRTKFATANLLHALKTNNEAMAAAMCSYLAIRIPELKQVRIEDNNGEVSIELVFDREYGKQVAVDFTGLH